MQKRSIKNALTNNQRFVILGFTKLEAIYYFPRTASRYHFGERTRKPGTISKARRSGRSCASSFR